MRVMIVVAAVVVAAVTALIFAAEGFSGMPGPDPRTGWVQVTTPDGRWLYDQTCDPHGALVKRDGTGHIFETDPNARECL